MTPAPCGAYRSALLELLDDPTGTTLAPSVRDHLGRCERCRTATADAVLTSFQVRRSLASPDATPSPDAWPHLRARVLRGRAAPAVGRLASPVLKLALGASLAVALAVPLQVGRAGARTMHEAGVQPAAIRAAGDRDARDEARQLWAVALAGKEASSDDGDNWARVALIRWEAAPVTDWRTPIRTPVSAAVE